MSELDELPEGWHQPSCYYWYGELGIISDLPGGAEAIKEHPELPAMTLKDWEAMCRPAGKESIP